MRGRDIEFPIGGRHLEKSPCEKSRTHPIGVDRRIFLKFFDVGDASGIFNAARNLGGSFTLAALASFQDQRIWLHSRRMEEVLSANDPGVRDYLASLGQLSEPGLRTLAGTIQQQAFVMTYNDVFLVMAVATFATLPLILFLRPLPKGLSLAMH